MAPREEGKFGKDALLIAGAILLAGLIIAGSIVAAMKQPASKVAAPAKDTAAQAPEAAPTDTNATISLDDDPVLGDRKKAKVAIVEFSDFECPFCQRFHKETFDKLVKDYVDTGKAVISFRDFPLSFHEPNASLEAGAANCVRKEKGDKAYFAFSQGLFENTVSNGKGLPAGKLDELIRKAGANPTTVNACAASDEVKQEIAKDMEDGTKAGISGTPSFVIGTLAADGTVTGERIVGAVPIDGFKTAIEKYLK
jgi:protein-disulfide isomerase